MPSCIHTCKQPPQTTGLQGPCTRPIVASGAHGRISTHMQYELANVHGVICHTQGRTSGHAAGGTEHMYSRYIYIHTYIRTLYLWDCCGIGERRKLRKGWVLHECATMLQMVVRKGDVGQWWWVSVLVCCGLHNSTHVSPNLCSKYCLQQTKTILCKHSHVHSRLPTRSLTFTCPLSLTHTLPNIHMSTLAYTHTP